MIDDGPSQTAFQVAAARAAHWLYDPAPHLLEDRIALDLLGPENAEMLDAYQDDATWVMLENRVSIPLRARYVEDRLEEAYARGVRQLIVLGAGLDSFAFRQPSTLDGLRVYELDHPGMQAWKRRRIEELGWTLPATARLLACDFEKGSATQVLLGTDFEASEPAFLSWMGVTYYLEKQTVESSLREFAHFLAPESELAFDVMRPWEELPARYEEIRGLLVSYLRGAQEPQVNRYSRDEIRQTLEHAGFENIRIETHETLERHFRPRIGSKLPFSERFRLVHAAPGHDRS